MDDKTTELRQHAEHCRRLAREIDDERTRIILRTMASEFDLQARQMGTEQLKEREA